MWSLFVRVARAVSLAILIAFAAAAQGSGARRTALVIVNGEYRKLPHLGSPHADGAVIRQALENTGFTGVEIFPDYEAEKLYLGFKAFLSKIRPGDQVLVFFSGYAIQSNNDNFLLPVDFDVHATDPVVNRALSLTRIQEELQEVKASLKILLVDGARDEKILLAAATEPGLAAPNSAASTETAVLFSTALNETSPSPPPGSAGKFAATFARLIQEPGSDLVRTFEGVKDALASGSQTKPWGSVPPVTFYFTAPAVSKQPYRHPKDKQEYVWIPGGTFQAGCSRNDPDCAPDEPSPHAVTLPEPGFWIGQTEVTVAAYLLFKGGVKNMPKASRDNPNWDYTDHPMIRVSWTDAQKYCEWAGGRLPTGDEWERAARGGSDSRYPWGDQVTPHQALYKGTPNNTNMFTFPVKHFEPNRYGLYGLAGNVWEWTSDKSPRGTHVQRGGAWDSAPEQLRVSARRIPADDQGYNKIGFRCVLAGLPK